MKQDQGTPQNLNELIRDIEHVMIGYIFSDSEKEQICNIIRDYLSQKFGVAYLETDDSKSLETLFKNITKRS